MCDDYILYMLDNLIHNFYFRNTYKLIHQIFQQYKIA